MTSQLDKTESQTPIIGADSQHSQPQKKKSLWQRYQDSKRGEISEEDLIKYTGMTKAGLSEWAKDRPGVGGSQAAGKIDAGATSGLGGMMSGAGYGGWGPDSNAPAKFPPMASNSSK